MTNALIFLAVVAGLALVSALCWWLNARGRERRLSRLHKRRKAHKRHLAEVEAWHEADRAYTLGETNMPPGPVPRFRLGGDDG